MPEAVEAPQDGARETKEFGGTSVLLVPAVVNKQVSYDDAYTALAGRDPQGAAGGRRDGREDRLRERVEQLSGQPAGDGPLHRRVPVAVGRRATSTWATSLRYGWPEQWIRILGKRIFKLDIKEYSLKKANEEGMGKGFGVELLEGDCDWPAVMKALDDIGYTGWAAAEIPGGGRERLAHDLQEHGPDSGQLRRPIKVDDLPGPIKTMFFGGQAEQAAC